MIWLLLLVLLWKPGLPIIGIPEAKPGSPVSMPQLPTPGLKAGP